MLKMRVGSKLAVAGVLAACGLAQAQTNLFDTGDVNTVLFNGALSNLGLSSGEPLSATALQRWYAAPFKVTTNSVVTEIDVEGFVPAGNEFTEFGWQIWSRAAGDPVPVAGDQIAGVLNGAAYIPIPVPSAPPRQPTLPTNWFWKLTLPAGVALPAGNYYVSVWGHGIGVGNTAGFPNFAWFINAQKYDAYCPVNTPLNLIHPGGTVPALNNVHGWRSSTYPATGFLRYENPLTVLDKDPAPPAGRGPNPQLYDWLYTACFAIIGNPTGTLQGACCLSNGGCSFTDPATCCSGGGTYKGHGVLCAGAGCPEVGACCLVDTNGVTSCITTTQATCTNSTNLGEYQGDFSSCGSCPATGACCLENGTCVASYVTRCTSMGGLYRGNGVICGTSSSACYTFGFIGDDELTLPDVGDTLPTSKDVAGNGQPIKRLHGAISLGDRADVYRIVICNRATFTASTFGNGTTLDTELAIFDTTGKGITLDDDIGTTPPPGGTPAQTSSQSTVTGQFVPTNGVYYLAVSSFHNAAPAAFNSPLDSTGAAIFTEPSPWTATSTPTTGGAGWPEWQPNGPSVSKILATVQPSWSQDPDAFGAYTVSFTGACFLGCYANCDGSSIAPILNANDFQCFLNSFAGNQNGFGYANCDASEVVPVLNANDFQCFLNSFAAGCPS